MVSKHKEEKQLFYIISSFQFWRSVHKKIPTVLGMTGECGTVSKRERALTVHENSLGVYTFSTNQKNRVRGSPISLL